MHRPWDDYFPLLLQISFQRSAGDTLRGDAANFRRPYRFRLGAFDGILPECSAHISRTDRQDVNVIFTQFDCSRFPDRIQRELAGAVNGVERKWNVSGNARDVNDGAAALPAHYRDHSVHRRHGTKKVRLEQVMACMHVGLCNGIEESVSCVVDPDIDALEVMQGQCEYAINFFRVPHIAGESDGAIYKADTGSCSFCAGLVTREHDDTGSLRSELLRNRFSDAHRCPGDYDYRSVEFHVRVVFSAPRQVKTTNRCRTISLLVALETAWLFFRYSLSTSYCFPALHCRCTSLNHATKR